MERKHIPETEHRLTILYAIEALGPVTGMQLLQFMVELDLMNYFTLQLNLEDMEAQKQIAQQAHPGGSLYNLTREGEFILDSFLRRIPASRRSAIREGAEKYRALFRQEQLAPADSFTMPGGSVCIRLRLLEKHDSLLDVLLYVAAGEVPTLLQQRWYRCAQSVYEAVLTALTHHFQVGEALPPVPADVLQPVGEGRWLLSLQDDPAHPGLTLLLPLEDEALARHICLRWPQVCQSLREYILQRLCAAKSQ